MRFRPCIDIHNGKVKQIVGSSLKDKGDQAQENYISQHDASYYADLYRESGLLGGHVILLNAADSPHYQETRRQAVRALETYPGGLQVGGGIRAENAGYYLEHGASHVIVTSYVFQGGVIRFDHLEELVKAVGSKHLVLDLSCRKKEGQYHVVTDRWQTFTDKIITPSLLEKLASSPCGILDSCCGCGGKKQRNRRRIGHVLRQTYADSDHVCRRRAFHGRFGNVGSDRKRKTGRDDRKCVGFVWGFPVIPGN